MARFNVHASSGAVALPAASTSKVLFQIIVPANDRVAITSWGVSFNGVSSTDTPVLVKLTRSSAGTGAASGGTITKRDSDDAETVQTTVATTWATTPPSAGTVIEEFYVHPQTGYKQFVPFGQEIVVGGSAITYLAVEVTTGSAITGSPSATVELDIEE